LQHDAFRELLSSNDPDLNARAIGIYRERYAKLGLYENSVYPGVAEGLAALTEAGATLFVATSKPQVFARAIIDHFGLAPYFRTVYGSELDGARSNKGDLIAAHGRMAQQARALAKSRNGQEKTQ